MRPAASKTATRMKESTANSLTAARPDSSLLSCCAPRRFKSVIPMMMRLPSRAMETPGIQCCTRIDTAAASLDMASTIQVQ
jgi:hypothetical protein